MKKIVSTKNLSHKEWLSYRNKGIGGSDVSVIAGMNPYKSVHTLWLEKTGQIKPEEGESEYAHFGKLLEPIVRKEFMMRTGKKVRQKHMLLQSEEYPFMIANVDGVVYEEGKMAIFEAKTASAYKKEIWEEGVPIPYILQVQHYMAVTGAKKTYIAALVGGNHFYHHVIERDEEVMKKIIAMEKYFWETYILKRVEPVADGSKATTDYLNQKFHHSNGTMITLPREVLPICEEYDRVSKELKALQTEKDAIANQLKSHLKEAEVGVIGERKVTWKPMSKTSIDAKRLKEEKPDIYKDYLTQTHYRRFGVA